MWLAYIAIPAGTETIRFDDVREVDSYNADPDLYAAAMHGLSKIEYLQWVDLDGAPLCGHRTRTGDLCRHVIGRVQLGAQEWLATHRKGRCPAHGGARKK
jgi:hypothetical protein